MPSILLSLSRIFLLCVPSARILTVVSNIRLVLGVARLTHSVLDVLFLCGICMCTDFNDSVTLSQILLKGISLQGLSGAFHIACQTVPVPIGTSSLDEATHFTEPCFLTGLRRNACPVALRCGSDHHMARRRCLRPEGASPDWLPLLRAEGGQPASQTVPVPIGTFSLDEGSGSIYEC